MSYNKTNLGIGIYIGSLISIPYLNNNAIIITKLIGLSGLGYGFYHSSNYFDDLSKGLLTTTFIISFGSLIYKLL